MESETIGKLIEALSKAQGQMENAAKDKANPFFKSKYADLGSVWDACRKPLSTNGLAVVQMLNTVEGKLLLTTKLCHLSGEWMGSEVPVVPVKNDPQGLGSAITYMRRYSLQAIVGIAPAEDDGEAAMGRKDDVPEPKFTPRVGPVVKITPVELSAPPKPVDERLELIQGITEVMSQLGMDPKQAVEILQRECGAQSLRTADLAQLEKFLNLLRIEKTAEDRLQIKSKEEVWGTGMPSMIGTQEELE